MAKNVNTEGETPEVKETTKSTSLKYSIDKLRENCLLLFGVSVSTFDGATHNITGDFTVDEMKDTLKKWGEKEVK